jgi:mRNA-degrading endonuclease RelE of RelBE toxin-antitoxin system
MKIAYLPKALQNLEDAPAEVRKAFFKQVKFLQQNLHHRSLRQKLALTNLHVPRGQPKEQPY